ncbi:MAG: hypothetical protein J6B96_01700 [Agathobacter sp.]|nr:hypothetical protein [Agathobacter sp.]
MKTKYGINSLTPINQKLKNGYTMYDWAKRKKCFPSFCMRTLSGENKITMEEVEFLKARDCKIGLVLRDLTEVKVSRTNGTEEALLAATAAEKLGVPKNRGIALFAEIKPEWSVNHNWMISFAQTLSEKGYVPAFIGNTDSSKNFNFDRQSSHYVQATESVNHFGAVFMATEPKTDSMPEKWEPYCPSALEPEDMHLWACASTVLGEIEVEDVYAKDEKVIETMW